MTTPAKAGRKPRVLDPSPHALALWAFLQTEWDRLGVAPTTWCRSHGIPDPTVLRWRQGVEPDVRNLRRVADALGRSMLDILVAAQYVTSDEANGHVPQPRVIDARKAIELDERISPGLQEAMFQIWDTYDDIEAKIEQRLATRSRRTARTGARAG